MLLLLRCPSHHLSLRRFCCRSSAPDLSRYREAFARRMAMAGVKPHHRIALGVSGGPDSMALCVLTAGWKTDGLAERNDASGHIDGILGIVVDHKLRRESAEEACQVRDRVSRMGIKCEIASCDWSDGRPKQGHLQAAARERRYQIFQDVCIERYIGVLLIAHHADDQAELFILRLSRNSGILGLAGMAFALQLFPLCINQFGENSDKQGILLVRPMLEFSKDDMYRICQGGNQEWVEDPTNRSQLFARNRIRSSLGNLSSSVFRSEMQNLISACRLTRSYVESICHQMINHSVTIMNLGYAIIDLESLEPSKVEDICMLKFLAFILQFISQRHRPVRGSVSKLLLDYVRNLPCKTAFTAAGCYLCAAPRSKGTKILVCCSHDLPQPSKIWLSSDYFPDEHLSSLSRETDQIIMDARTCSNKLVPKAPGVPFLFATSSEPEAVLNEAKKLGFISQTTYEGIHLLQHEETRRFSTGTEVDTDNNSIHEVKVTNASSVPLCSGELYHFMGRFLVTWRYCKDVREHSYCNFCMVDQERTIYVRPMVEGDWLFLAKLSERFTLENSKDHLSISIKSEQNATSLQCSNHMQISARRALQALKSIPVAARRALPVLVNSHGSPVCIPSICFSCCPCLSGAATFKPRVPLGGGYTSFI